MMQGRRLLTSLAMSMAGPIGPIGPIGYYCPKCNPGQSTQRLRDPLGRPFDRPIVFQTMHMMEQLSPRELKKYGHIFSELLGLPKPPEEIKTIVGDKFAVKLVKYDKDKERNVWRAVGWVVSKDAVLKSIYDFSFTEVVRLCENAPSVIKQCVSKEEAEEMVAKVEAAGGVAVMEKLD